MRCHLNLTVSISQHSTWWHWERLWWVERFCDGRLLAIYDQFIKDYHGSQVLVHWCFYERTCEREVGYKRLITVCCRRLLRNSATDVKTIMMATFLQLMQRTIKMSCQRDAAADTNSPSVTSLYSLYTENYTGDTEYTAKTLCKLKYKIKHIY